MTLTTISRMGRPVYVWAVIAVVMLAWVMPMVAPPASAVTEYRLEVVVAPPTPLDYKGVAWAADGSEATIVGGVQALLRYGSETRRAVSVGDGNWSTTSQTLEDVIYAPDGTIWISGGSLDGGSVNGNLWQMVDDAVRLKGESDGDIIQAVTASPGGRIIAVGALGTVLEYKDGALKTLVGGGDNVFYDAAWAPDGSGAMLVGAAGTIVWLEGTTDDMVPVDFTSTHPLYAVAWHPDEGYAWAVGEGGLVVEINSTTLETNRVRPYTPRSEDLFGVAWHPEGEIALVVGEDGVAYVYRLGIFTQQWVDTNKYLLDVQWNPAGDEALVVGESGTVLRYTPRIEPQNRAPNAVISSPEDGVEVEEGPTIEFDGSASSDPDDDPITFAWTYNGSSLLGFDPVIERVLPLGTHTVTLTVDDGQGNNDTASVTIHVVEMVPPVDRLHLEIVSPKTGNILDGEIDISGTAIYELGDIAVVEISIDGGGRRPAEGTTEWSYTLDTTILLDGFHSIEVKVTTDDSEYDSVYKIESVLVEVRNAVVPEPPAIPNITLHLRDHGNVDELIKFSAEGEDDLSSWLLVWSFGDGSNGQGERVRHAYSEEGTYQVTLSLWLEGYDEPAAMFTATIVIETAVEDGMSVEMMIFLSLVAAGVIYIAGYYGGRRAFGRD